MNRLVQVYQSQRNKQRGILDGAGERAVSRAIECQVNAPVVAADLQRRITGLSGPTSMSRRRVLTSSTSATKGKRTNSYARTISWLFFRLSHERAKGLRHRRARSYVPQRSDSSQLYRPGERATRAESPSHRNVNPTTTRFYYTEGGDLDLAEISKPFHRGNAVEGGTITPATYTYVSIYTNNKIGETKFLCANQVRICIQLKFVLNLTYMSQTIHINFCVNLKHNTIMLNGDINIMLIFSVLFSTHRIKILHNNLK